MFGLEPTEAKNKDVLNMIQGSSAPYFDSPYQVNNTSQRTQYPYYPTVDHHYSPLPNVPRTENSPPLSVTSQTPSTSSPSTYTHTSSPAGQVHKALPTPPHLSPVSSPSISSVAARCRSDYQGPFPYQTMNSGHAPEFMNSNVPGSFYANHSPHPNYHGIYGIASREGISNLPTPVQQQALDTHRASGRSEFQWMRKETSSAVSSSSRSRTEGRTRTRDKYRVVYSEHQRLELEKEYNFNRYITIKRKTELADSLALSERQIKIWFQNRRAKDRKNTNKKKSSCKDTAGSQMLSTASSMNHSPQHSLLGTRMAQPNSAPAALNSSQDGTGGYIIPETSRVLPSQEFQNQIALGDGQQGVPDHAPPDALQLMHLHHQQDHHQHHHQRQQQHHQQFGTQQHSSNVYPLTPSEYAASSSFVSAHTPFLPAGGPFHHDVSPDIRFQHQMANIPYFDAFHNSNPYHHQHQTPHMQQHQQLQLHQQLQQQHQHQQSSVSSAVDQHSEPVADSVAIPITVNPVEKTKRESSPNVKSEYSP